MVGVAHRNMRYHQGSRPPASADTIKKPKPHAEILPTPLPSAPRHDESSTATSFRISKLQQPWRIFVEHLYSFQLANAGTHGALRGGKETTRELIGAVIY